MPHRHWLALVMGAVVACRSGTAAANGGCCGFGFLLLSVAGEAFCLRVRLECRRFSARTGEPPAAAPASASGPSYSRTRSTGKLRTAAAARVEKAAWS